MRRPRSREGSLVKPGELVSDRLVRFPGASWQEIEALPQPLRWTVQLGRSVMVYLTWRAVTYGQVTSG